MTRLFLTLGVLALSACAPQGGAELQLELTEVSISQGVKRMLFPPPPPGAKPVMLVQGREALVRVHYRAQHPGQRIAGSLALGDGRAPIESVALSVEASSEAALESSLNFWVPGKRIGERLSLEVNVEGRRLALPPLTVTGPANAMQVVLVPFRYDADGSQRLPDLSAAQLQRYTDRFYGLYPTSKVDVMVREAVPWPTALTADGEGFRELGFALFQLRQRDQVADDVYFVGVVDPAPTLEAYCSGPCLVGLTVLNDAPLATGTADLRLALAVGFPQVAADAAAHEVGHAHGLRHAPCGDNLEPASLDADYPHASGALGTTGFDLTTGALVLQAEATDLMGYCGERWVSDYHFAKLLERVAQVNRKAPLELRARPSPVDHEVLIVDGAGRTRWLTVSAVPPQGGQWVRVALLGANHEQLETDARWFTFDHLSGGFAVLPSPPFRAVRAEVYRDGPLAQATR